MARKKYDSFESNIRVYRKMKNLTQQELAVRVGISSRTIIQLEKGRYNPSLLLAQNVAEVLGISLEKLFTFESIADPDK